MKKRFLALVMSLVMSISVATTAYATEVETEESNSIIESNTIEETSNTETSNTETRINSGVELAPSFEVGLFDVTKNAYDKMKEVYYSKEIANSSSTDVTVFWEMLAKSSICGISSIDIDFDSFDYYSLNAQKLAKVVIAMANNIYQDSEAITALKSFQQSDGSFNNVSIVDKNGNPYSVYATDQVWPMIALEIADADYDYDKAVEFLIGCQNSDGGYGYGSWSDVGTTSWVICLSDISDGFDVESAVDYCESQWDSIISANDSSSMSAYVSTGLVDKEDIDSFVNKSYNSEGYFTWGSSTKSNSYATSTSVQALGDYYDGSIYSRLDSYYTVETPSTSEPETPSTSEPETPPAGNTGGGSAEVSNEITVSCTISVPGYSKTVSKDYLEDSNAFDVVTETMDSLNIGYSNSGSYISTVTVSGVEYGYGYNSSGKDGIMYSVNGVIPDVSLDDYNVEDGDNVKLFYCENYEVFYGGSSSTESTTGSTTSSSFSSSTSNSSEIKDDKEEISVVPSFSDVSSSHWAYDAISFVASNNIMKGFGNGDFGPDSPLTRAQVAQILYNLYGNNEKLTSTKFSDVNASDWYYDAVVWSHNRGIFSGTSDSTFNPNNVITRQQVATVLGRTFGYESGGSLDFTDSDVISSYAEVYIASMVESGIISGFSDGSFNPNSPLTRAQGAVLMMRILMGD